MIILSDDLENHKFPIVNVSLILTNCLIFMYLLSVNTPDSFYFDWGTVPARFVTRHDFHEIISSLVSLFLHGGFLHLIGNMWALYLFGDNVEERMGHCCYLLFYLACGFFAGVIDILADPASMTPTIGASGAIAGVMGAYIAMHPTANCNTWWGDDSLIFTFKTFKIPAVLVIFGWFVLQIISSMSMDEKTAGIAFYAHIGGFLVGLGLLAFIKHDQYRDPELNATVTNVPFLSLAGLLSLSLLLFYLLSPPGIENKSPSKNPADNKVDLSAKNTPESAAAAQDKSVPDKSSSNKLVHHSRTSKVKAAKGVQNSSQSTVHANKQPHHIQSSKIKAKSHPDHSNRSEKEIKAAPVGTNSQK